MIEITVRIRLHVCTEYPVCTCRIIFADGTRGGRWNARQTARPEFASVSPKPYFASDLFRPAADQGIAGGRIPWAAHPNHHQNIVRQWKIRHTVVRPVCHLRDTATDTFLFQTPCNPGGHSPDMIRYLFIRNSGERARASDLFAERAFTHAKTVLRHDIEVSLLTCAGIPVRFAALHVGIAVRPALSAQKCFCKRIENFHSSTLETER